MANANKVGGNNSWGPVKNDYVIKGLGLVTASVSIAVMAIAAYYLKQELQWGWLSNSEVVRVTSILTALGGVGALSSIGLLLYKSNKSEDRGEQRFDAIDGKLDAVLNAIKNSTSASGSRLSTSPAA